MEVDPSANEGTGGGLFSNLMGQHAAGDQEESAGGMEFIKELMASVPGIDEATSFGEVMKSLDDYNFDVIIFDTAPTGHTLRLLNFPNILEKGLLKLMELKDKFGGMMSNMGGMMGGANPADMSKKLFDSLDGTKAKIE